MKPTKSKGEWQIGENILLHDEELMPLKWNQFSVKT
jgi:hypothetical protein